MLWGVRVRSDHRIKITVQHGGIQLLAVARRINIYPSFKKLILKLFYFTSLTL